MATVTVGMATMKGRGPYLKLALESLLKNPVDKIYLATHDLEEGDWIPDDKRIQIVKHLKDNGDADKFYGAVCASGYVLTCDDDLIYPPNYVEHMLGKVDKYKCPCSLLGHIFLRFPMQNYFGREDRGCYGCLREVNGDHPVMAVGTGVLAYHKDMVYNLSLMSFPLPNMADIWFSMACQRAELPMMAIGHTADFLKYTDIPLDETIAGKTLQKNEVQCALVNHFAATHKWKVRTPE